MPNENYVHTITLYNCLRAADNPEKKDIWHRHVMKNCFYKSEIKTILNGTQAAQANTYIVRIPEREEYLPYHVWAMLPEEERQRKFTFSDGDIVLYGEQTAEITGEPGKAAAQILNRHKPDAFRVTAISINTAMRMAPHYRLGG